MREHQLDPQWQAPRRTPRAGCAGNRARAGASLASDGAEHPPAVRSRADRRCVLRPQPRAGGRRKRRAMSRAQSRARCVPHRAAPGPPDSTHARSSSYIRPGSRAAEPLPQPLRSSAAPRAVPGRDQSASRVPPRRRWLPCLAPARAPPLPCGEARRERTARGDRRGLVGRERDGRNTVSRANRLDPSHAKQRARAARATADRTRPQPRGRRVRARAPACRCETRGRTRQLPRATGAVRLRAWPGSDR